MGGETNNGLNLSLVHHANVVFSGGAFFLILVVVMAFCLCRRGYCLQWVLGPNFMQRQELSNVTVTNQQQATAPSSVPDQVEVEIEHLKRANQLLELQQRRNQLLAPVPLGEQGVSRRDLSAKYPVHLGPQ